MQIFQFFFFGFLSIYLMITEYIYGHYFIIMVIMEFILNCIDLFD